MPQRSPLEWIQRNRTRKDRVQPVSTAIGRLAFRLSGQNNADALTVVKVLQEKVDREFRRSCCILVRADGPISVQVGQPGLVYSLRQRWLTTVAAAVAADVPKLAGRRIVFEHGVSGLSFREPEHRT